MPREMMLSTLEVRTTDMFQVTGRELEKQIYAHYEDRPHVTHMVDVLGLLSNNASSQVRASIREFWQGIWSA